MLALVAAGCSEDDPIYLYLSTTEASVVSDGGTVTTTVESNSEYTVVSMANWITQTADGSNEFTVSANTSLQDRTGKVVYTAVSDLSVTDTLTVSQRSKEVYSFSTDTLTTDYLEKVITVPLTTNTTYELAISEDWLTEETSSRAVRTDSLYFHVEENTGDKRTAVVTLTTEEGKTTQIVILQKAPALPDYEVMYHQEASIGSGLKIAFVGDGFVEDEEAYYEMLTEWIEDFFDIEPYRTYREYFEVYGLCAGSEEEGLSVSKSSVETAFGVTIPYPNQSTEMDYDEDKVESFVDAHEELDGLDLLIIVGNSSIYAGTTWMFLEGYSVSMATLDTTAGIIRHEAGGHGLGWLADEYIYYNRAIDSSTQSTIEFYQGYGLFLNVSFESEIENTEWGHLVDYEQYADIVGMYEGAYMYAQGIWRSEYISIMDDNRPYFNTISRELIVRRIMSLSGGEFSLEDFLANDIIEDSTIEASAKGSAAAEKKLPLCEPKVVIRH